MAIQKINLGTEPLGEGGDTYRSANTKINENFSNTDHAASRLVGTATGNVMEVGAFGVGKINVAPWTDFKEVADTYTQGICSAGIGEDKGLTNLPPLFKSNFRTTHLGISNKFYPTGLFIQSGSTLSPAQLAFYGEGSAVTEGNIHTVLHTSNTKRDSNTNLLLYSGEEVSSNSAASRLVGTATGNVMEVGAFGVGKSPSISWTDFSALTAKNGGVESYGLSMGNGLANLPPRFRQGRTTHLAFGHTAYPSGLVVQNSNLAFYFQGGTLESGITPEAYCTVWHTRNTDEHGTNGYLKPSSPILKIESDKMWANADGEAMGAIYTKRGVGDYEISNTTGLRSEGWYIEIPNDLHGNPHVAVTIEDVGGNIHLKCFKRIFNMNTFKFEPDLDSPMDIPEGRWIDLRFNDLPQEQLEEPELVPEEEPIEVEVEETEVSEEPVEESK